MIKRPLVIFWYVRISIELMERLSVKLFNQELCGDYGIYYYLLKEDDYQLYHYEP